MRVSAPRERIRRSTGHALSKLAYHPAGPTILAVALALISLPLVAPGLGLYRLDYAADLAPMSLTDPARWTTAMSAVLLAAVIGGSVGGWLIRHRSDYSYWTALLLAWIGGIGGSMVLPWFLRQNVGAAQACLDGCSLLVRSDDPTSGFVLGAIFFWLGAAIEYEAFGALVLGFVVWSQVLLRYGPPAPPPRVPRWGLAPEASFEPPGQVPSLATAPGTNARGVFRGRAQTALAGIVAVVVIVASLAARVSGGPAAVATEPPAVMPSPSPSNAPPLALLQIQPASQTVRAGSTFSMTVAQVSEVQTSGTQVSIVFDPSRIRVVGLVYGNAMSRAVFYSPDVAGEIAKSNETGTLRQIAAALGAPAAVPPGQMDFLTITFAAIGCGQTSLGLPLGPADATVLDGRPGSYGDEIPITTNGATVTVVECATPSAVHS